MISLQALNQAARHVAKTEKGSKLMKQQSLVKSLHYLFIAALIALLTQAVAPAQTVRAQEPSSTSDLAVNLVSMPNHAKACEVFQAIFTVTNLGPDPVSYVFAGVHLPDAYNEIAILGSPYSLAVGETATFSAIIWVGGFEPGENRRAWVGVGASLPANSIDPNLDNNRFEKEMKIISKPVVSCLPRY
jgi:hypothetical protein